ncbi:MAG: YigZ family protein [Methylococcaceae bacterium]
MNCVKAAKNIEFIIKRSRFIGQVIPCSNEKEVSQQLKQLHQHHVNASHIAYAYRIKSQTNTVVRFFDAGEPSGTAGKPILQHLEGKDLINTLIAVIRYFGGIKLGAGGLTRAYSNAAKQALEGCNIQTYVEFKQLTLQVDYKQLPQLEYHINKLGGSIEHQDFAQSISVTLSLPITAIPHFTSIFKIN